MTPFYRRHNRPRAGHCPRSQGVGVGREKQSLDLTTEPGAETLASPAASRVCSQGHCDGFSPPATCV